MQRDFVLDIIAQGAWNGGTRVDNSIYENKGMLFKGGIPVTRETIEERIGVRTRMVRAPWTSASGSRRSRTCSTTSGIDPARIRVLIAATNIGEDKYDPGPIQPLTLYDLVRAACPQALVFDLYAGCPGFNVGGGDALPCCRSRARSARGLSPSIVGAENIHRAQAFKPLDTANIIFGDDALATALETGRLRRRLPRPAASCAETAVDAGDDFIAAIADALLPWARDGRLDGIIVDNQLGRIECRIPATAARVQHALMERLLPQEAAAGAFKNFRSGL